MAGSQRGCVLAVSLAACGGGDEEPAAEDATPSEAPSDALDVEIDEAIEVIPAMHKLLRPRPQVERNQLRAGREEEGERRRCSRS